MRFEPKNGSRHVHFQIRRDRFLTSGIRGMGNTITKNHEVGRTQKRKRRNMKTRSQLH